VSVHRHQPRIGLHQRIVAGQVGHRPARTVGGDGAVDEPGVQGAGRRIVETELGDGTGPQALHEDVGAADEAAQDLEPPLALEVEREAALVAVEGHERGALLAPEGRRPGARVVTAAGPLDLDDLRAHVAEDLRAERPRNILGEIDDDEPVEWERHGLKSTIGARHRGLDGTAAER
jgi:hypothetical protein